MNKLSIILFLTLLCSEFTSCGILTQHGTKEEGQIQGTEIQPRKESVKKKESIVNPASIAGEWIIISANGKGLNLRGARPFLMFHAPDGKLYGNLGCNVLNGDYSASQKGGLSFSNVITTLQTCDNMREENEIIKGLNATEHFSVYKKGEQLYLDLTNLTGDVVIQAKRHNADVLSGTWDVEKIRKQSIEGEMPRLVIDIPELKLHGNAGCNIINGSIGLDRNKDWFIQFQDIISTRVMCDEKTMATERDLQVALEEVEVIKKTNGNTVKLLDKNNEEVLLLKRVELKVE